MRVADRCDTTCTNRSDLIREEHLQNLGMKTDGGHCFEGSGVTAGKSVSLFPASRLTV
jgi:hypothetical protein